MTELTYNFYYKSYNQIIYSKELSPNDIRLLRPRSIKFVVPPLALVFFLLQRGPGSDPDPFSDAILLSRARLPNPLGLCPRRALIRFSLGMNSHSDNTRPWTRQSHTTSFTRPLTGLPRPGPAQAPTTAATSHYEAQHSFIIALLEGRGIAREVGMAALDRDTGRVMLIQVLLSRILCEAWF
jgi:hypothetical protein